MKKSLAAVGVSTIGLALVGAGAAAPAAAEPIPVACTDMEAQFAATGDVTSDWFQSCIPQYGLGKVEFQIESDVPFPAEFVPLDQFDEEGSGITATSTTDTAGLRDYIAAPEDVQIVPILAIAGEPIDDYTQGYGATVFAPILTIGNAPAILPDDVAAECGVPDAVYGNAYVATYAPIDTTFSQTINGVDWSYTITATPKPSYFLATFPGPTGEWCVTDGTSTIRDSFTGAAQIFGGVFHSLPDAQGDEPPTIANLGTFQRNAVAAAQLPPTGSDVTPFVAAAGGFLAFGLAFFGFAQFAERRRRANA